MTEKATRIERLSNMNKPVPMKLFAAWEVDRTPPNCIPRYFTIFVCHYAIQSAINLISKEKNLSISLRQTQIDLFVYNVG